jgi:hypothetical protein
VNHADPLPEKLSQKDFAALIGISAPMVSKHKKAGRLVMDGGLVLVEASMARIAAAKDPARGGDRHHDGAQSGTPAGAQAQQTPPATLFSDDLRSNYTVQAAREKLAAAQLRELELAREAGQLVLKQARDDAEFGRARMAREAIMSLPDRLSVLLAAEASPESVHALLTAACRKICAQLARSSATPAAEAQDAASDAASDAATDAAGEGA